MWDKYNLTATYTLLIYKFQYVFDVLALVCLCGAFPFKSSQGLYPQGKYPYFLRCVQFPC